MYLHLTPSIQMSYGDLAITTIDTLSVVSHHGYWGSTPMRSLDDVQGRIGRAAMKCE